MDSNQIDVVENGAIVKVFLLEGPFPWNTPTAILDSAGDFWESFALTHAALGFLVEESETRHRVEGVGEEEEGGEGGGGGTRRGLGDGGNGTTPVEWNNDAVVRVSSGFDEKRWISANYIAKITGLLYNDITGWSSTYREKHPSFQPLSACGGSNDRGGDGDFAHRGSTDSYDFVWAAFDRLAKNGVIFDQEVVIKPKRTVMCLFPEGGVDAAELVDADGNEEIAEYYRDTGECVRSLAAAAASGNSSYAGPACPSNGGGGDGWAGEGGVSLMLGLGDCLAGHENAFLYHNSSAYLRLPLNVSSAAEEEQEQERAARRSSGGGGKKQHGSGHVGGMTARLVRYSPALPPRPEQPPGGPDRAYIVYLAVGLAAVGLAVAGLRSLYRRRRREKLAAYGSDGGSVHGGGGGGGGGGGFGAGGRFSSSSGLGWRSGGRGGSDFGGNFDGGLVGGGVVGDSGHGYTYEGAMFPADNYSSGGLSGSSRGGWRSGGGSGGSGKPPASVGPMEVPLLNQSDSPLRLREGSGGATTAAASPSTASSSHRRISRGGGGRDASPPPFSRVLGTMGSGPAGAAAGRRRKTSGGSGGGGGRRDRLSGGKPAAAREEELSDDALDQQGPFGGGTVG
ncbi:unnamed protein product, partial [Ectocarpus fasciculatus]